MLDPYHGPNPFHSLFQLPGWIKETERFNLTTAQSFWLQLWGHLIKSVICWQCNLAMKREAAKSEGFLVNREGIKGRQTIKELSRDTRTRESPLLSLLAIIPFCFFLYQDKWGHLITECLQRRIERQGESHFFKRQSQRLSMQVYHMLPRNNQWNNQ